MDYDPTLRALFSPETQPPLDGFGAGWTREQICAELCRLAYIRFEDGARAVLDRALDGAGFSSRACFHDADTGAQAIGAVAGDGTIFLAFRGTQIGSARDVMADLDAWPVRWPGPGRVHHGFWRACRSLLTAIEPWLAAQGGAPLVLTGHSLGAAMATLLAALRPDAALVTFGSPRVGTKRFVAAFAGRSVQRYVDCTDGVTHLPWPIGYRHVAAMTYIDHRGHALDPAPDAAAIRADRRTAGKIYRRACAFHLGNVPTRSGADHAPINYVSALLGVRRGP
jgi:pimeloyl-ACP methyl ester carboxylesterase